MELINGVDKLNFIIIILLDMDNSQQRKIPSKVCEICHGNEGFLQPKPCKCGEKLKVIH